MIVSPIDKFMEQKTNSQWRVWDSVEWRTKFQKLAGKILFHCYRSVSSLLQLGKMKNHIREIYYKLPNDGHQHSVEEVVEAVPDDHHQAMPPSVLEEFNSPLLPAGGGVMVAAIGPAAAGRGGNSDLSPAGGGCTIEDCQKRIKQILRLTRGMGNICQSRVAGEVTSECPPSGQASDGRGDSGCGVKLRI